MTQQFRYEIQSMVGGIRPGHHRSRSHGAGFEFRAHAPLISDPDLRRLDLHATLRDPFGDLKVRSFRERRAVTLQILADVSGSLAFGRPRTKLDLLADFSQAAAYSAYRTGDAFGFLAAADRIVDSLSMAPGRSKTAGSDLRERLSRFEPAGAGIQGLLQAAQQLGRRPHLVFLASDYHFPDADLESLLSHLARHYVIPVVLWNPAEVSMADGRGMLAIRDLESGHRRTVLLRPVLRHRIRAAFEERKRVLQSRFARHGLQPLVLQEPFDADRVTHYFRGMHVWPAIP